MESNILSHTLSNNSDKKINEGSHRKKKKIINKTNWTLFQYVGSCEIKRFSDHLLVRKRLLILSSRKSEMLHASTVLFSFLQEVNTSRGSPCPQPFKFPNAPISIFLTNCAGSVGSKGPVSASTWPLVRSKDSLHVIVDNFKSVDRVMLAVTWKLILFGNNVWLGSFPDLRVDLFTKGKEV